MHLLLGRSGQLRYHIRKEPHHRRPSLRSRKEQRLDSHRRVPNGCRSERSNHCDERDAFHDGSTGGSRMLKLRNRKERRLGNKERAHMGKEQAHSKERARNKRAHSKFACGIWTCDCGTSRLRHPSRQYW